ncbi:MAG: rhodanese-like domain-containing protein [Proteobacteria bacterium]|nr:rhodanese-like domain-containing protein [Pseudomonadota bacterium]
MDPYKSFFIEHWLLSAAFMVILILLLINEWRTRTFGIKGISPQQLVDLLNHTEALAVDIRSEERFELGHILGAISLPEASVHTSLKTLNKHKNKPIVLVSATGMLSPKIGKLLLSNGFSQLYQLSGGMENWHAQGMPVVKK